MRTTTPSRTDSKLDLADAWLAALLLLVLLLPGCATRAVWSDVAERDGDGIEWSEDGTITAIAITPITLAVDVALLAALACAGASGSLEFDGPAPRDDLERWHASRKR